VIDNKDPLHVLWPVVESIFELALKLSKKDKFKEESIILMIVII